MNQIKTTKKSKVLQHLLKNKSITSIEAIKCYSATRLSAIIYDLKKMVTNLKRRELLLKINLETQRISVNIT